MEKININVMGEELEVDKGVLLKDLAEEYQPDFEYKIVCARINGVIAPLTSEITKPCEIEYLQAIDKTANRIYINGLIYMCLYAYKQLFGRERDFLVSHSLDKGIYIKTYNKFKKENARNSKRRLRDKKNYSF